MSATLSSWPGRSPISTFVHTLHLLDLDQLDDFPGVTVASFGPKSNLQHRLRCVEWSLYRLFELYDARLTRDKLKPFFPPATSLQAVNLRAAFLRQLSELKKDGVLGQDKVLRKTMLDECKGDKFEELLAGFSIIALKKVLSKKGKQDGTTAVESNNLVPLVLSYRRGIQSDLQKRKELGLRARQQQENIDKAIQALNHEMATLRTWSAPDTPPNFEIVHKFVRENWIGDTAWIDALLTAVPPPQVDLNISPDDPVASKDTDDKDSSVLLVDLQKRVQAQKTRLARWQVYLKTVEQGKQAGPVTKKSHPATTQNGNARFTRHQTLHLEIDSDEISRTAQRLMPKHAALLESMDRELTPGASKKSTARSTPQRQHSAHARSTQSSQPPSAFEIKPALERADRSFSTASSQDTVVAGSDDGHVRRENSEHTPTRPQSGAPRFALQRSNTTVPVAAVVPPPQAANEQSTLLERTRASLAHFETPTKFAQTVQPFNVKSRAEPSPTVVSESSRVSSDRASLLERTRQSMSMLTNVLDDSFARPHSNLKSHTNRPRHTKSKSMTVPQPRRRLERAWSEESLASTATKDEDLDVEADYESVFKSRPRLAMSPNLSPKRSSKDLWLESQLEESMNKLTINSSQDY